MGLVRLFNKCLGSSSISLSLSLFFTHSLTHTQVQECLEDHIDEADFSSECKEELDTIIAARVADFRLDTELREACEQDLQVGREGGGGDREEKREGARVGEEGQIRGRSVCLCLLSSLSLTHTHIHTNTHSLFSLRTCVLPLWRPWTRMTRSRSMHSTACSSTRRSSRTQSARLVDIPVKSLEGPWRDLREGGGLERHTRLSSSFSLTRTHFSPALLQAEVHRRTQRAAHDETHPLSIT